MLIGLGAVNYLLLSGKKALYLQPAGSVCPLEKKGSGLLTKGSGEHTGKNFFLSPCLLSKASLSSTAGVYVMELTRACVHEEGRQWSEGYRDQDKEHHHMTKARPKPPMQVTEMEPQQAGSSER